MVKYGKGFGYTLSLERNVNIKVVVHLDFTIVLYKEKEVRLYNFLRRLDLRLVYLLEEILDYYSGVVSCVSGNLYF